jgi:hypothetical protein
VAQSVGPEFKPQYRKKKNCTVRKGLFEEVTFKLRPEASYEMKKPKAAPFISLSSNARLLSPLPCLSF